MKKILLVFFIVLILLMVGGGVYFVSQVKKQNEAQNQVQNNATSTIPVANFDECVAAKYPVMETYPRRCKSPDGKIFTEDIGNELELTDMIRLSDPRPNAKVSNPLIISGEARGTWFFEGSFPARILDANKKELGHAIVTTQSDWMTQDFVLFSAIINFDVEPTTATGTLILEKDNPSGLPENAKQLIVPIKFK